MAFLGGLFFGRSQIDDGRNHPPLFDLQKHGHVPGPYCVDNDMGNQENRRTLPDRDTQSGGGGQSQTDQDPASARQHPTTGYVGVFNRVTVDRCQSGGQLIEFLSRMQWCIPPRYEYRRQKVCRPCPRNNESDEYGKRVVQRYLRPCALGEH